MKPKFDPAKFVRLVGQVLVRSFESARVATTPSLVGGAIECAVRNRLDPDITEIIKSLCIFVPERPFTSFTEKPI